MCHMPKGWCRVHRIFLLQASDHIELLQSLHAGLGNPEGQKASHLLCKNTNGQKHLLYAETVGTSNFC
uniref:Uncharacterized protein n=1 Tax=Rhizophora mucronata TaxID=61149 RepID=A0A2P2IK52_RHIMU